MADLRMESFKHWQAILVLKCRISTDVMLKILSVLVLLFALCIHSSIHFLYNVSCAGCNVAQANSHITSGRLQSGMNANQSRGTFRQTIIYTVTEWELNPRRSPARKSGKWTTTPSANHDTISDLLVQALVVVMMRMRMMMMLMRSLSVSPLRGTAHSPQHKSVWTRQKTENECDNMPWLCGEHFSPRSERNIILVLAVLWLVLRRKRCCKSRLSPAVIFTVCAWSFIALLWQGFYFRFAVPCSRPWLINDIFINA